MSIKLAQILQDYFSHQYVWPRKKHLEKSKKGGNRHTLPVALKRNIYKLLE